MERVRGAAGCTFRFGTTGGKRRRPDPLSSPWIGLGQQRGSRQPEGGNWLPCPGPGVAVSWRYGAEAHGKGRSRLRCHPYAVGHADGAFAFFPLVHALSILLPERAEHPAPLTCTASEGGLPPEHDPHPLTQTFLWPISPPLQRWAECGKYGFPRGPLVLNKKTECVQLRTTASAESPHPAGRFEPIDSVAVYEVGRSAQHVIGCDDRPETRSDRFLPTPRLPVNHGTAPIADQDYVIAPVPVVSIGRAWGEEEGRGRGEKTMEGGKKLPT